MSAIERAALRERTRCGERLRVAGFLLQQRLFAAAFTPARRTGARERKQARRLAPVPEFDY